MGKLLNPYKKPTVLELEVEKAIDTVITEVTERGNSIGLRAQKFQECWSVSVINVVEVDGDDGTLIYIPGVTMDQVFKKGTFE